MLTSNPLLVPGLRKSRSYTSCHPDAPLWSVTGPLYLSFCTLRNMMALNNGSSICWGCVELVDVWLSRNPLFFHYSFVCSGESLAATVSKVPIRALKYTRLMNVETPVLLFHSFDKAVEIT
jgi:hypothetical protein